MKFHVNKYSNISNFQSEITIQSIRSNDSEIPVGTYYLRRSIIHVDIIFTLTQLQYATVRYQQSDYGRTVPYSTVSELFYFISLPVPSYRMTEKL